MSNHYKYHVFQKIKKCNTYFLTDLRWTQMISPSFHDFTIFRIIKCGLQKKLFSDKMNQENSCKDKGNIKIFIKLHIYKIIYLKWKILYKILHIQVSVFMLLAFITFLQSAFFIWHLKIIRYYNICLGKVNGYISWNCNIFQICCEFYVDLFYVMNRRFFFHSD